MVRPVHGDARALSDDTVRLDLNYPIEVPDANGDFQPVSFLLFRRLKGAEIAKSGAAMRYIARDDPDPENPDAKARGEMALEFKPDALLKLIARSARIPLRSAENLDGSDFTAASGIVQDFLANGPVSKTVTGTPPTSSATSPASST